jgi:Cu2+-exporting ATPase
MACGSGCCGDPAPASLKQSNSNPALGILMQEEDRHSCCSDADLAIVDKNTDQLSIVGATRGELTEEEACCAPKPDSDCKKGCCSAPNPPPSDGTHTPVPGCCEGKAAPCCDQSCLDRLALRECENFGPCLAPHSMRFSIVYTPSGAHVAEMTT